MILDGGDGTTGTPVNIIRSSFSVQENFIHGGSTIVKSVKVLGLELSVSQIRELVDTHSVSHVVLNISLIMTINQSQSILENSKSASFFFTTNINLVKLGFELILEKK